MKLNNNECLLVEDFPIDQEIARLKIIQAFPNISIIKVSSCQAGLEILQKRLDLGKAIPFLLLVDINMKKLSGFDFIEGCIKMGFTIENKPKIAILTSSIHPADLKRSQYYKIIDEFFVKPLDTNNLKKLIPFY